MSFPRRGFLYWIRLDKRRPALVVSPDYRNEHASDVIVVPCSTQVRLGPTHVLLRRGEGGVGETSVLKCEQITTLHRDDVGRTPLGSALAERQMREVHRAVLRALGIVTELRN
jgi:mRNA-degrading endonuclease toxin of MazEF toxin-antitoxin module